MAESKRSISTLTDSDPPQPISREELRQALIPYCALHAALITNLFCWLLLGAIAYATSRTSLEDQPIEVLVAFLWVTELGTGAFLLLCGMHMKLGYSGAATFCSAIGGASGVLLYGLASGKFANGAVWGFWLVAGIYGGVGVEVVCKFVKAVEDWLTDGLRFCSEK